MTTEAELVQRMADLGVTSSSAFELMLGKVRGTKHDAHAHALRPIRSRSDSNQLTDVVPST